MGWLINLMQKQVEVYRPSQEKQVLENPTTISGEEVLEGLVLALSWVWDDN